MNVLSPHTVGRRGQPTLWPAGADLGRMGRPASYHEVATAAAFLLSEEAAFISGVDLKVDGGSYSRALLACSVPRPRLADFVA